ncbi:MAG TPA: sialidase family protein [Candidatus Hydrogenedentes bacterium]|nr:sialidase family protein [Candidatus Hydrogenedentota bacterium]
MLTLACFLLAAQPEAALDMVDRHVMVYYEPGRFGGWPANHGIWIWGNEILVGFSRGYYKDLGPHRHHIDREKPEEFCLARSVDGGETWAIEHPNDKGHLLPQGKALHGVELPGVAIKPAIPCPGDVDFTHPDFAMTLRMSDINAGPARFYYSYDRGHTWEGPFAFPNFDTPGVAARTDYIVDGPHACTVFLTAAKRNGTEGRPFCARTTDGAKTWEFVSWIAPEHLGFAIMPATVRLSDTDLITVVRRREWYKRWLNAYVSRDNGATWEPLNDPVETLGEGNPPSLIKLRDGRLCLNYGYRAAPFSICAKLSDDGGRTWSDPIVLRDDGANRDIGYCRAVQRPDGKVVTLYYFNDLKTGPERYIAATIWQPPPHETTSE